MAELRVNPTRMELKKVQARYVTARRGHKLLKDKRDELMKKFLDVVKEDKAQREKVEAALSHAQGSMGMTAAVMGPLVLKEALMLPRYEGNLEVGYKNIMSVTVPEFAVNMKQAGEGLTPGYGMAFTSGELDATVTELSGIVADLIYLAQLEKTAQMLAEEIEKTRRRVNALEYIMMPQYLETIRTIKMKLEENERGNTTRLMKVKDMMLKQRASDRADEWEPDAESDTGT